MRRWFAANGIGYVRAVPSALLGGGAADQALTSAEEGGWWLEDILAQLGWVHQLSGEGGLFVTIGRAPNIRRNAAFYFLEQIGQIYPALS